MYWLYLRSSVVNNMTTAIGKNHSTTKRPLTPKKSTEESFAPKESEEQEQATSMTIFFILLVVGEFQDSISNG